MSDISNWTQEIDGISYRVRIVFDTDTSPADYDGYTPRQVDAWKRDEWIFVGVIVTPDIDGLHPWGFGASLWGIVYGDIPLTTDDDVPTGEAYDSMAYIRDDVVPELAHGVWSQPGTTPRLAALRDRLTRILLS